VWRDSTDSLSDLQVFDLLMFRYLCLPALWAGAQFVEQPESYPLDLDSLIFSEQIASQVYSEGHHFSIEYETAYIPLHSFRRLL
jgi:hypothetical protein